MPTQGEGIGHPPVRSTWYRDDRCWYLIVAVLTVLPILIIVIRAGLDGWAPTFDEAHTVLRARYSLGRDPGLLGIYTDASNWIDSPTYFPGPWWLWWMALPIRVLGATWGPLLAIASLNAFWFLLAGWSVKRRLGPRAAMAALVFLGALTWGLGNSVLLSASGQVMIVPVFAACCFVAWALAAGDEGVLPALALITNFILLDEVVLVRLLPPIIAAAVVIWGIGLYRVRARAPEQWPAVRSKSKRAVLWSVVISAVMWIPSIVQEFTDDPGNLTNLWRVAGSTPTQSGVWLRAYDVLVGFFVRPPFWLRGSRDSQMLFYDPSLSGVVRLVTAAVVIGSTVWLARSAIERRDRAAVSVLALAAVTFLAAWYNLAYPPTPTGVPTYIGYFLSTWAVAMFITFALGFALVRAFPGRAARFRLVTLVGCAAALAALNLPHANFAAGTYASSDEMIATARALDPLVVDAVEDRGRVQIARPNVYTSPIVAALAVALDDASIPFCIEGVPQWSDLPVSGCRRGSTDVTVEVLPAAFAAPTPGATVIARYAPLSAAERKELDVLGTKVDAALASATELAPTAAYEGFVRSAIPPGAVRRGLLDPSFLVDPTAIIDSVTIRNQFAGVLANVHQRSGSRDVMLVHLPGVSDSDLLRWAQLEGHHSTSSFVVTMTDGR
ncbi:MAG TPA: hypothetical protein VFN21_04735 [Acidimicrobiales bacterium]|nr:hypothetical protein [Acidimicrobiales bacterium]